MINLPNKKVAAIVPAFNEEKNIGNVLKVLLESPDLNEIIVVDDGSSDKTSSVAKSFGVKVIRIDNNGGKARAMRRGLDSTDMDIVIFFDADLVGLTQQHIHSILNPVLTGQAVMCIGIRDRFWGLPGLFAKLFPVLSISGAERAIRPFILKEIPKQFIKNMGEVVLMNYYCKVNHLPVSRVRLDDLDIIIKEKKYGLFKGFIMRLLMIFEIISISIGMIIHKKEFKSNGIQKNNFR